jgi:hypothetical protein
MEPWKDEAMCTFKGCYLAIEIPVVISDTQIKRIAVEDDRRTTFINYENITNL